MDCVLQLALDFMNLSRAMKVAEEAASWERAELARMRDHLVVQLAGDVGATMHDGGPPAEGVADQLDEQQWNNLVGAFFANP